MERQPDYINDFDLAPTSFNPKLYTGKAVFDETGPRKDQQYFYRAMKMNEAKMWFNWLKSKPLLSPHNELISKSSQPFASYRKYSLKYLLEPKHGYDILLEFKAPEFLTLLSTIGVLVGKPEDGDMSWGIGAANQNGFKPTKATNKTLKQEYGKYFPNEQFKANNARSISILLTPIFFGESIDNIKVVDLLK